MNFFNYGDLYESVIYENVYYMYIYVYYMKMFVPSYYLLCTSRYCVNYFELEIPKKFSFSKNAFQNSL